MALRIEAAEMPLRVLTSGRGASPVKAMKLQDLANAGCDWRVQDGGGKVLSEVEYTLQITGDGFGSCSSFYFYDCAARVPGSAMG